jgi:hypothetical protein
MRWLALAITLVATTPFARADQALPSGEEIARRVNARDEGETVVRTGRWFRREGRQYRARTLRSYRRASATKRSEIFFEARQ